MRIEVVDAISSIDKTEWNRVAGTASPFTRHEFLAALEAYGCVGEHFGWLPRHLAARDSHGRLVGAVPLYEKHNSYGELVFDWAWADAYQRHGLSYYPKLVSAVPYTPATGRRLLMAPDADTERVGRELNTAAIDLARAGGASSLHWLFPTEPEADLLQGLGMMRRVGCQFHWLNRQYADFDDFLGELASRKRKNIRRERQMVADAGLDIEIRLGGELTPREWSVWHRLYASTFERKGGLPTLSSEFFQALGQMLPDEVVVIFARRHGDILAGAFCMRGEDTLYGRHWGAFEHVDNLHFETCYYQGIEYCIREGIGRFEPGAQGEHKVARGFLPTPTWSAHWIDHEGFRTAIDHFLEQETRAMTGYMRDMSGRSPYRDDT